MIPPYPYRDSVGPVYDPRHTVRDEYGIAAGATTFEGKAGQGVQGHMSEASVRMQIQ